jgi:hypothetical protein
MKTLKLTLAYLFVASVMAIALTGNSHADEYTDYQMLQNQRQMLQEQRRQDQWVQQQAQQQQWNQQMQRTFNAPAPQYLTGQSQVQQYRNGYQPRW